MGRGGKKKGQHGKGKGGSGGGWNSKPRAEYVAVERTNKQLERFYDGIGLVPESDRKLFWDFMRKDLPNSFRFTGSKGHALAVQQRLIDHYIPQISSVKYEGKTVEPPAPVDWFPEKLAWAMNTPKQIVRKFAPFSSFQKFLVSETSVGNISRQEIVSMIPPLLMDIRPGMTVLDMCAAPGSKSAQLIELVHGGEEARIRKVIHKLEEERGRQGSPDGAAIEVDKEEAENEEDWEDDGRATGMLIANDSDYKRAQMLVHQVKRLNSPNLIVTNHDASLFPSIRIPSDTGNPKYLKFDRILADVPCSGDGTARKNYNVWKDWMPGNGMGLHSLQVRILVRTLQMLKVGGRAVYSTCSLNPVENEAVIASAIALCGGLENVKIVDAKDQLPGLKRTPGLKTWKLMDKTGRFFSSWKELETARDDEETKDKEALAKFSEGMFAPVEQEGEESLPLERCMRVYPHFQNTGGFFIVVLEKQHEIRAKGFEGKKTQIKLDRKAKVAERNATDSDIDQATSEDQSNKRPREEDHADEGTSKKLKSDINGENGVAPAITEEVSATEAEQDEDTKMTNATPDETDAVKDKPATNGESFAANGEGDHPLLAATNAMQPKRKGNNQPHEEPYKYLDPNHTVLQDIYSFYQLDPRFPRDRWMVRNANGDPVKTIYYTSALVRDILTLNEGKGMKFVQAGVKVFMRQDAQGQDICRWRIQGEGMSILDHWVGEDRVVRLYKQDTLRKLLREMFIKVNQEAWKELGEIGAVVRTIGMGCCVLRVEASDAEDGFRERMVFPLWRSIAAVNLMLPKEERKAMLLRLYNDNTPLIDHSQQSKKSKQEGEVAAAAVDGAADEEVKDSPAPVASEDVDQTGDGIEEKEEK